MKNLLLILLATLFVACNEGTRYDEPDVPKSKASHGMTGVENVQWELSDRWQPISGGSYVLEPTYVSVVHIEKAKLAGDSINLSNLLVNVYPQNGNGIYYSANFTYEETNSELILNIECSYLITEEPRPYIFLEYIYYTTY